MAWLAVGVSPLVPSVELLDPPQLATSANTASAPADAAHFKEVRTLWMSVGHVLAHVERKAAMSMNFLGGQGV